MKEISAGFALIVKGRVLLVQSGWNQPWGFPKGKTEPEDLDLYDTAKREIKEELNIDIKVPQSNPGITQKNKRKDVTIFPLELDCHLKIKPNEEIYTFAWFSFDELRHLNLAPNQAKIMLKLMGEWDGNY